MRSFFFFLSLRQFSKMTSNWKGKEKKRNIKNSWKFFFYPCRHQPPKKKRHRHVSKKEYKTSNTWLSWSQSEVKVLQQIKVVFIVFDRFALIVLSWTKILTSIFFFYIKNFFRTKHFLFLFLVFFFFFLYNIHLANMNCAL